MEASVVMTDDKCFCKYIVVFATDFRRIVCDIIVNGFVPLHNCEEFALTSSFDDWLEYMI